MIYTAVRFKRNFSKATRLSTPTCPALSYDSSTNRLTGIGGLAIGYDAAGNQLNDIWSAYEYDAEGRVKHSSSTGQWQYPMYSALGQGVMDDQGGANPEVKLTYPVDIFGQRTGTWAEYTNWTGWNVYWSQVAGQRLNMGGSSAFIDHSDAVGSTTMETDPSGAVVWDVTHYPSGKVFQEQGTRQSEVALGLDWQVNDPAIPSATREYNFRVYRWQTPDRMGGDVTNPQSLNRYAYVLNNPTTLTDPMGLNGDCSWDVSTTITGTSGTLNCPPDRDTVGYSPGGCSPIYVNGGYAGSTCGGGTGSLGGHQNGGAGVGGGTMVAQSGLTVRQKGQSFTQCMQQNSNNYSIGGAGELLFDKLSGKSTSVTSNPIVSIVTGNGVSGLIFGSPEDQATSAAAFTPHTVGTAMGAPLTWGRRTTDILDLNLLGKGGVPQALSSGTKGIKSFLGELDNALSLGMEFTTRLAIDTTLTLDEAIGCQEHSASSLMVF